MRVAFTVIALLLLAGCTAKTPANLPPAENGATGTGSEGAPGQTAIPAPLNGPRVLPTPFSYDGTTATGACLYAIAAGACQTALSKNTFTILDFTGDAVSIKGQATWQTANPELPNLRVFLLHQEDDGGWYWRQDDPYAVGTSPLALDWDFTGLELGNDLALSVSYGDYEGAAGAGAYAAMPQDFHLEGNINSTAA